MARPSVWRRRSCRGLDATGRGCGGHGDEADPDRRPGLRRTTRVARVVQRGIFLGEKGKYIRVSRWTYLAGFGG
jgi:hypothetical protein